MHKILCVAKMFFPPEVEQACFTTQLQAFHKDAFFSETNAAPEMPFFARFSNSRENVQVQVVVNNWASPDKFVTY